METFTKSNVKQIASEIEDAVQEIAKKYNINMKSAGGSFSGIDCTLKLKLRIMGEVAEKKYANDAKLLGLPADIIGKTFNLRASTYTIKRVDLNKIKYPVIAENQNGKSFKFGVEDIKQLMNLK